MLGDVSGTYYCTDCNGEIIMRLVEVDGPSGFRPRRTLACRCTPLETLEDIPPQWEVASDE